MARVLAYLSFSVLLLNLQASTRAQNIVIPAGTLIHCTLDEPNFSSASVSIGDPVICHLSSLREFGQNVFPRGSYLGGHLEAAKEPGHFVGKGYLRIRFDRIGFANSDIPVPGKVVAAQGYRVDRKGDIVRKGHAARDAVEWLLPPMWPLKIATLPARGPRPTLKGEEQLTLRLMDDIEVPRFGATSHSYDRPPYSAQPGASYHPQSFERSQPADAPAENAPGLKYLPPSSPAAEDEGTLAQALAQTEPLESESSPSTSPSGTIMSYPASPTRLIALNSGVVYTVAKCRIEGDSLNYVLANGAKGSLSHNRCRLAPNLPTQRGATQAT